jgi:hypothetical protein
MNRDDYRHLLLSGTVTFPATFPQLGSISVISEPIPLGLDCHEQRDMLVVKEFPSAKVTISRKVFADRVRAVFIPQDPNQVSYACGTWLLGNEIAAYLNCQERVLGIVFVSETESTLLEVHAGMTAGESAQYYPPLPCDRSFNHYGGTPKQRYMLSCSSLESGSMNDLCRAQLFSCDAHDDISFEMCSCDSCDTPFDS